MSGEIDFSQQLFWENTILWREIEKWYIYIIFKDALNKFVGITENSHTNPSP